MTFILIMSSVTMVLAVHEGHRGNRAGVMKWMAWTILGGIAFLLCQAWEWHHLITGEHPVLADGKIELIGQTMGGNPWGHLAGPSDVTNALKNSSPETLAKMIHDHHHDLAVADLMKKPKEELIGMINLSETHIREKGPIAFGGYFFGITGFHGFHVFSGVIINVVMLIMASKGVFDRKGHYLMIEKAGLYWHFVDLVWVFVFLCFYLV
jgi:cytochrome c oxidase subunit 3